MSGWCSFRNVMWEGHTLPYTHSTPAEGHTHRPSTHRDTHHPITNKHTQDPCMLIHTQDPCALGMCMFLPLSGSGHHVLSCSIGKCGWIVRPVCPSYGGFGLVPCGC